MGKNDFLSPKAIANRIKSKGLQKLRWYCQMCQKQCRDENGFKCHLTSESHKRQMMVFGQAPMRVVDGYSEEFESTFLEQLRQSHGSTRVSAKVVYNEFINDRNHVHMNSTKWLSLTEFVQYLGKEGLCRVDETPKGWFISLIQKDAMEALSDERRIKRSRAEKEEEDRLREQMEAQIERAQAAAVLENHLAGLEGGAEDADHASKRQKVDRPKSKLEQLMQQDQARKAQAAAMANGQQKQHADRAQRGQEAAPPGRTDAPWLHKGIVVKVMAKELKDYYKVKGQVVALVSRYVAEVSMLSSGDVLRIDQAQLETVLPSPGGAVLVLRGQHAASKALMLGVDTKRFKAQVQLPAGTEAWLDYEDVCKLHSEL
ncbi:hypothetical protein WJX73_010612 [Symbiochloris irregularis]|uniref:DNA/RNA-binding protein Kin17 WH-like domain-containing protein n=1 Tax=Symbiochloris irregularis TaxID=706552 RepID=A0AAW1PND8_9CHLO